MSNTTIAAPAVQSTEFDYATACSQIAATLDNSKDFYQASKQAYLAVKGGAIAATLAKGISSSLSKNHKDSTIKSIAPATLSYRIAAYRFIVENNLPEVAATVNATYTLVSKTSGVRPGLSYLPEILKDFRGLAESKQTRTALLELIETANNAAKPSAKPKKTADEKKTDEPVQSTEPVVIALPTADEVMAYVRAALGQGSKINHADKARLASFFKQTAVALGK
jgi:hypothetical protein